MDDVIEHLKLLIRNLTEENRILRDENESLWEMLDEIKKSDESLKEQLDEYDQDMIVELLSNQEPVGEA
jgi:regulator of replication initiation timing